MRAGSRGWLVVAASLLALLLAASWAAPEHMGAPRPDMASLGPLQAPPFGTDDRGHPLHPYAMQGAAVVTLPALGAGLLVALLSTAAGLVRAAGLGVVDGALQVLTEIVGSLPRMVVILVVALMMPRELKALAPIALAWALLAAPGAMDEAASTAGRLGGARFVEALRAHGFSGPRIYLYHVAWLNLRPVVLRQAAEVGMQVVFLEIALSYLAVSRNEPALTHADSVHSWATLLYLGYTALLGEPLLHALALGLLLVGAVALAAQAVRLAARAR